MKPVLPQLDPDPQGRSARLAQAREELVYTWDRPLGVATATALPRRLGYPPGVLARVAAVSAELAANRAAARLRHGPLQEDAPSTITSSNNLFSLISLPPIAHLSSTERAFAWQRIAGANPFLIERTDRPAERLGLRALPAALLEEGDTLDAAAAEGRAFVVDWGALLAGIPSGKGRFLPAPIALLIRGRERHELTPIALRSLPDREDALAFPGDGSRWEQAKLCAQVADANAQESFFHLGRAHFLTEAFALATERQLSERHPLSVLLSPHFHGTLAINQAARDELIVPGGQLEMLMAPSLEGSLTLVRRAIEGFKLDEHDLAPDLARRGVDSTEALPVYPFRDDAIAVREAIDGWVLDYVSIVYGSNDLLLADTELRAWLDELRSPEGGRLAGLPERLERREDLARMLAFVLYTTSVAHAAVNYTQADFLSWTPGMPTASYAEPPAAELPSQGLADKQLTFMYQQTQVRDDRLGDYPPRHFEDERVGPALQRFQQRLREVSAAISARQSSRFLPYPYLDPTLLTASIHI